LVNVLSLRANRSNPVEKRININGLPRRYAP
jgi:hypothetical protein